MSKIPGVILAGGLSRRMGGGDKSLLHLGGQTILSRVIARLAPQVSAMALNANGPTDRFSSFGLPVIADSIEGYAGPLAGVLAGLDWAAAEGASHIATVAADTPFFPKDLVAALEASLDNTHPIALAATRDDGKLYRHPTFGIWPVSLRDDLRTALKGGLRKVVLWTDAHGTAEVEFPTGAYDPFFNVNTPDDLQTAARVLEGI